MYPVRPESRIVNSGYLSQSSLDRCRYGNWLFTEMKYRKVPKFLDTRKLCCNHHKTEKRGLPSSNASKKMQTVNAKSEDP